MESAPLLEATSLTKRYGRVLALDSVTFAVGEGITGLLGPNGAGKSTAIKLFLGLLQPTGGAAQVMGAQPYHDVNARSLIGYMPEHDCLPTSVNASEFLTHMAQVSGLPPAQARTRAADTMRHVGLDEARYRSIGEYSTGMKQRVKLAQAIVHDPRLVLLDEPTAGLDPGGREEMLDLVKRTGRDFGISIVFSSHLMGEVERTCDNIIVLDGGRVTHQESVSSFTRSTDILAVDIDSRHIELVSALASRGIEAEREGNSILVSHEDGQHLPAIQDALIEAQAPLRRMGFRRRMLTEIFRDSPDGSDDAGN